MQNQIAIILYKYTNDFHFNITKLKTIGQIHNPLMTNINLLWIYRQLLQLHKILTENKQIFYSKLKYITISGCVKLKTLHQPCYCKIMKHNDSWIIHAVKNCTNISCVHYSYRPSISNQSPESNQGLKKTTWKDVGNQNKRWFLHVCS
jgi:hypothetical protein